VFFVKHDGLLRIVPWRTIRLGSECRELIGYHIGNAPAIMLPIAMATQNKRYSCH
jgi:hypothetical protein